MSVKYPHIQAKLIGEDGNAFNLISLTNRVIERNEGKEAADSFMKEAMDQSSYTDLLAFIQQTVVVI